MTNARKADDKISTEDAAVTTPPENATLTESAVAEFDKLRALTEALYIQVNGKLPLDYTGE